MARKRMFRLDVLETDTFMDMPLTTQALYFHLNLRADDDGFLGNPNQVVRSIGASMDDLKLLIAKRFILTFEDGVIVIKHWRLHNTLSQNRYHETNFTDDKAMLRIKDNKAYTFDEAYAPLCDTRLVEMSKRQTIDEHKTNIDEQKTVADKNSIGKVSIDKDNNILSDKSDDTHSAIVDIIAYLNHVVGTKYTVRCKSTNEKITARLREGHTVDDFKTVIDKKYAQWGNDPKMAQYLRPETLFSAAHFESYLNEVVTKVGKKKTNTFEDFNQRQYDYDELLKDIGGQSV